MTSAAAPLAGLRVLVTRDPAQASGLSAALRQAGAEPIEVPLIEIQPVPDRTALDAAHARIHQYDWLIFTSANTVRHFGPAPDPFPAALRVCAIGPASKDAAAGAGWQVSLTPQKSVAESVVEALRSEGELAGRRVLFPVAAGARDVIPLGLRAQGAEGDVVEAYRTVPSESGVAKLRELFANAAARPDWITLASPSTVKALLSAVAREQLEGVRMASIGPITSAALTKHGLQVDAEAREQSPDGMVQAIAVAVGAS